MRLLYTILYAVLLPLILVRLYWRGRALPSYRQRWTERLGFVDYASTRPTLWVHAVSVGEVLAAIPLVKALQQTYPERDVVMTTMTPTGAERVQAAFGESVTHIYLPYDVPLFINRFLKAVKPTVCLIIETELWPNLIHCCQRKGVPTILVNARLSEKSARGYARAGALTRGLLTKLSHILAQNENTAKRFLALGIDEQKVLITGSIKYDLDVPTKLLNQARKSRELWQSDASVLVAASTHLGEEEKLLMLAQPFFERHSNFKMIIVPRHPERFDDVHDMACRKMAEGVIRKSRWNLTDHDWRLMIGDTMGEMFFYFGLGDIVFMGGTLVPRGGHNFIEPAALALPIIAGKHYFNFQEIGDELVARKALIIGKNEGELAATLEQFVAGKPLDLEGEAGKAFVDSNTGALEKSLNLIKMYTLDQYNGRVKREEN